MKILITGVNGQVGDALCKLAKQKGHDVIPITRLEWDMYRSPNFGEDIVLKHSPDLVINPAAYTNVVGAESEEDIALRVNANAPRFLAKGCYHLNIPLFHLSTDYVFNGLKQCPYDENDNPSPINAYGRTKLAGEMAIKETTDKYLILRTSWVFSKNGKNFVNTILRLARNNNDLQVVDDEYGGPTSARSIANILLESPIINFHSGIYHFCGHPYLSWKEFAIQIIEHAHRLNLIPNQPNVISNHSNDDGNKIPRPKNSMLKSIKKIGFCDWKEDLLNILKSKIS